MPAGGFKYGRAIGIYMVPKRTVAASIGGAAMAIADAGGASRGEGQAAPARPGARSDHKHGTNKKMSPPGEATKKHGYHPLAGPGEADCEAQ